MRLNVTMEREESVSSLLSTDTNETDSGDESSSGEDEYEANIDFSNACRDYYLSRVEATETFKKGMKKDGVGKPSKHRRRSTIDEKMDKLRTEMASLMDQDVSLMKQLLTLNETINEIKHGSLSSSSKGSIGSRSIGSRGFVSGSDWSFQSEMSISPDDGKRTMSAECINPFKVAKDSDNVVKETKISVTDLWKVKTQTSNDSGYVEGSTTSLVQTVL